MNLNHQQIMAIAVKTIGQRNNPDWHSYRNYRFTASNFGKILKAEEHSFKNPDSKQLTIVKDEILKNTPIPPCPPMQWGIDHEARAIKEYEKRSGFSVKETGIWLFPSGHLAASPDGLIMSPSDKQQILGCVEIKCPYRMRNVNVTRPEHWNANLDYLDTSNNLLRGHQYYHQIQGEIIATNSAWCDFVVWCPTDLHIERIFPDRTWRRIYLSKLEYIYFHNFLRPEDRAFTFYRRNPDSMEEVALMHVLSQTNPATKELFDTFVTSLAIHLKRWNIKLAKMKEYSFSWEETPKESYRKVAEKICGTCLVKLFLYTWQQRHINEEDRPEVVLIREKKWTIPEFILSKAINLTLELKPQEEICQEPCMCARI